MKDSSIKICNCERRNKYTFVTAKEQERETERGGGRERGKEGVVPLFISAYLWMFVTDMTQLWVQIRQFERKIKKCDYTMITTALFSIRRF